MRFWNKIKRTNYINIIVAVVAVILLAMPTFITYQLIKRSESVEERMDHSITAGADMSSEASQGAGISNDEESYHYEKSTPEEADEKKEIIADAVVSDKNNLTATVTDATSEDADMTDSSAIEASATDVVQEEVVPNGKKVYLTFDDGPSDYTEELLDILDEYGVKATFFVVKNNRRNVQLKHIVDRGHTIGLHSSSHVYSWIYKNQQRFETDVNGVHDWVENITGVDTRLYRFPGGSSNSMPGVSKDECVEFLYNNGYEYFDWNAESRDAENMYLTPEQLNDNVMRYVRNNEGDSIVLMHDLDDHHNTTLALPALIETLQSEGYELCTLDMDSPTFHHYLYDEE